MPNVVRRWILCGNRVDRHAITRELRHVHFLIPGGEPTMAPAPLTASRVGSPFISANPKEELMSPDQIVRGWKEGSCDDCSSAERNGSVPAHPVGPIDIADSALDLAGASLENRTEYVETLGCCQGLTQLGKCDFTAGYPYCTQGCFTIVLTAVSLCKP